MPAQVLTALSMASLAVYFVMLGARVGGKKEGFFLAVGLIHAVLAAVLFLTAEGSSK